MVAGDATDMRETESDEEGAEIHAGVEHGVGDGGCFFIRVHPREGVDGRVKDAVSQSGAEQTRADGEHERRPESCSHGCEDHFGEAHDESANEEDNDGNAEHFFWTDFIADAAQEELRECNEHEEAADDPGGGDVTQIDGFRQKEHEESEDAEIRHSFEDVDEIDADDFARCMNEGFEGIDSFAASFFDGLEEGEGFVVLIVSV